MFSGTLKAICLAAICAAASAMSAATYTVVNLNDSGPGSLRQAIIDANSIATADTIVFETGMSGTIYLLSMLPNIEQSVEIIGPGPKLLAVQRLTGGNYAVISTFGSGFTMSIHGLTIRGGHAANAGGLVFTGTTLTVSNCVFDGNTSGGLWTTGRDLTVTDTVFAGNTVNGGLRAAIGTAGGNITISGCTFVGNESTTGALNVAAATVRVLNCTISGNYAGSGVAGLKSTSSGDVEYINCTIVNNVNASTQVGHYGGVEVPSAHRFRNCIIAGNTVGGVPSDIANNLSSQGHNIFGSLTGTNVVPQATDIYGTNAAPIDPMIGPLADNGGLTRTHALLPGSPAIDAGTAVDAPPTDQRGVARLGPPDIGAYEYAPGAPVMAVARGAIPVANGGSDDVGPVPFGVQRTLTWTIANSGNAPLSLLGSPNLVAVTPGANLTAVDVSVQPSSPVAQSSTTTFTVAYTVDALGPFDFTISIDNDDSNANPYTWTVTGTGAGDIPEMAVTRGLLPIDSGSVDSIGNASVGTAAMLEYTIANNGGDDLDLTGAPVVLISNAVNCTAVVTMQPAGTTILPAGAEPFSIEVTPSGGGAFAFTVSIASNDAAISPYTWTVLGTAGSTGGGSSGNGGNDDKDDGCSTSSNGTSWLLIAGLLAALALAKRRTRHG